MPSFYEEAEFDINVTDFLEECNIREIEEVIEYLQEMGYLEKSEPLIKNMNPLEIKFQEDINKISSSRLRLTKEEEEIISRISNRL